MIQHSEVKSQLYLKADEAAEIFSISGATIRRLAKQGRIPSRKVGGSVLIPRDFVYQTEKRKENQASENHEVNHE